MEHFLTNFSETHRILAYLIISLSIFVEGEVILLLAGVLSHRGYLNIFTVMTIAFMAVLAHDIIYWSIGRKLASSGRKKFLFINIEKVNAFLERMRFGGGFFIFISKFAWSLNKITLISNGYKKTSFKKLLTYSIPACLIWSVGLVMAGRIFAFQTKILRKDIKTAGLMLLGFLFIVVIFENIIKKIIEKMSATSSK